MPPFGPISRDQLVRSLIRLGFAGPISGGKHQFMIRGKQKVRIPNPHESDVSRPLLTRILKQARISKKDWEEV